MLLKTSFIYIINIIYRQLLSFCSFSLLNFCVHLFYFFVIPRISVFLIGFQIIIWLKVLYYTTIPKIYYNVLAL